MILVKNEEFIIQSVSSKLDEKKKDEESDDKLKKDRHEFFEDLFSKKEKELKNQLKKIKKKKRLKNQLQKLKNLLKKIVENPIKEMKEVKE